MRRGLLVVALALVAAPGLARGADGPTPLSVRRPMAAMPPRKNMKRMAQRYITPIFLWSMVEAQSQMVARMPPLGSR